MFYGHPVPWCTPDVTLQQLNIIIVHTAYNKLFHEELRIEIFGSKSDYEKPWAGSSSLYEAQEWISSVA